MPREEIMQVAEPAVAPGRNGLRPEGETSKTLPQSKPRRRSNMKLVVIPVLLMVLVLGAYLGFQYWVGQQIYVSTDNAQVAGPMVQVGALNAGRVENVQVNVGDRVQRDQVVGTILLPTTISMSQDGTPVLGFVGSENQRAQVKSPISGIVVARSANPGATVVPGQTVITLVDPTQLWVDANIDETQSWKVHAGQEVEVHLDALNATLPGHVEAITDATASSFSLLPQSNTTGNFTKVTQVVTARISVDFGDRTPPLGSSASVKIRVE